MLRNRRTSMTADPPRGGKRTYWAVALVLALLVAACGDNGEATDTTASDETPTTAASDDTTPSPDPSENPEDVEISIWFGREDFIPIDAFESFMGEYPYITVNTDVIPLEQAPGDFIRAMDAGQEPDIVQIYFYERVPLVLQGVFRDIGDILETFEQEDPQAFGDLQENAFIHAQWDDVQYGLVMTSQVTYIAYRVDLFEEAGLEHPPETFEDMLDAAYVLKEAHGPTFSPFCIVQSRSRGSFAEFSQYYMGMGGEYDEFGVPVFNNDAGHYFIDFFQTLRRDDLITEEATAWGSGDMRAAFLAGNCAFAEAAYNVTPGFAAEQEYGEYFEIAVTPYREGHQDERDFSLSGHGYFVSANTEHPEEVGLVLRYLAAHPQAKDVHLRYNPSTNQAVWDDPDLLVAQPWLETIGIDEPIRSGRPQPVNLRQLEMDEVIMDLWEEIAVNVDDSPEEIAQRYDSLLDEFRQ